MSTPLKRPIVLVVEDDPTVRLLECGLLQLAGYSVLQASNGDQALALAVANQPNLIVLDVGLPSISGLQVLDVLAAESTTCSIPVLIVSSYAGLIAYEHRSRPAGSLTKPFAAHEFVALVGQLIQAHCALPVMVAPLYGSFESIASER
jgi:DNA-binding response OmpR family regulator